MVSFYVGPIGYALQTHKRLFQILVVNMVL